MLKKSLIAAVIVFITSINVYSQKEKVQSAFIYNFITKYFEWPAAYKSGDFYLGVLGNSPIIDEFNTLASSRKVGNQKISVKKFNTASEITLCHVLYICGSKIDELESALGKVGSTLVITDSEIGSNTKGVAINFKTVEKKQKFELKAYNATMRGLIISPDLGQMLLSSN